MVRKIGFDSPRVYEGIGHIDLYQKKEGNNHFLLCFINISYKKHSILHKTTLKTSKIRNIERNSNDFAQKQRRNDQAKSLFPHISLL